MVALEQELRAAPVSPASADAIPIGLRRIGGKPRQVFAITLIGTLVLAVFASRDLASWLDRMGDGSLLAPLQQAGAGWDGAMSRLGFTRAHQALRDAMRHLLDWQWGEPP